MPRDGALKDICFFSLGQTTSVTYATARTQQALPFVQFPKQALQDDKFAPAFQVRLKKDPKLCRRQQPLKV